MGGTLVTLGSDAHGITGICHGFEKAKATLNKCGFDQYRYFKTENP